MGTKTIRVTDEVYEKLTVLKRPGETYSDLLERLLDRDALFEHGFGRLAHVDFESALHELDQRHIDTCREQT